MDQKFISKTSIIIKKYFFGAEVTSNWKEGSRLLSQESIKEIHMKKKEFSYKYSQRDCFNIHTGAISRDFLTYLKTTESGLLVYLKKGHMFFFQFQRIISQLKKTGAL